MTPKITLETPELIKAEDGCSPCAAEAVLPEARYLQPNHLAERLAEKFPRTVEAFRTMEGGLQHLAYISALEERWKKVGSGIVPRVGEIIQSVPSRDDLPPAQADYDLVYCGGVLGLFSAAVMARKGYKVLVFDQRRVGTSHREWNISDEELEKFVEAGLFTPSEIEQAVAGRYSRGVVRFHSQNIPEQPAELWLDRVLDVAIDLGTLLEMARQKFEEAGGVALDFRSFQKVYVTEQGLVRSVVEVLNAEGQVERFGARLTVNALGSISPLSLVLQDGRPFDGVCPTVGSTARNFKMGIGLNEVEEDLGDVLVTVEHAQKDRQYIWEGFPGKHGEMTVYLFYYDTVSPEKAVSQSLLELFEDYFELLETYKAPAEGFAHLKPVYGYIPARHHQPKIGSASHRGIISVGDATSPQSALTFCGFGSQVRNLPRLTRLLDMALTNELLEEKHLSSIGAHQTNINLVWVFSRFMQPVNPARRPNDVNRMMNVFCAALTKCGPELTKRFFQDKIRWNDYNKLTLMTAWYCPRVYPLTLEVLGLKGTGQWALDYLKLTRETLLCKLYSVLGQKRQQFLENWATRRNPELGLKIAARREEWQACGWLT